MIKKSLILITFFCLFILLTPVVSGGYMEQTYNFNFINSESGLFENISAQNKSEIDLLSNLDNETNNNHTLDKGKVLKTNIKPSLIYFPSSFRLITIPFLFTVNEIMTGIQNLTLMLPFKNYTGQLTISVYQTPIFNLDINKSILWYKTVNPELIQKDNRSYARLPFICILPARYYLIQLIFTDEVYIYISAQQFSEKSPLKSLINNTEINLTFDMQFKITAFLNSYGGSFLMLNSEDSYICFEQYYDLSNPFDTGLIYIYIDVFSNNITNIPFKIEWYNISGEYKTYPVTGNETLKNYYVYNINNSDGDPNKKIKFFYYSNDTYNYYIPLIISDKLTNITYKNRTGVYFNYTSMLRSSATLLYGESWVNTETLPIKAISISETKLILGSVKLAKISLFLRHYLTKTYRIFVPADGVVEKVIDTVLQLPRDFLELFYELIKIIGNIGGQFINVVKHTLSFAFDFIVQVIEYAAYWLIGTAIPILLIFIFQIPLILGAIKIKLLYTNLFKNNLVNAKKYLSFKPWEFK